MNVSLIFAISFLFSYCSHADAKPSNSNYKSARRTTNQQFIIGGKDALPGAWPWQLSFQAQTSTSWVHFCGAVLLNVRNALTAAHCVDDMWQVYPLRVVAGLHDRRDSNTAGVRSAVNAAIMHPQYNPLELLNDIATLGLEQPIHDNGFDIGFASLPQNNNNDFSSTTCVLTGWGRADHNPDSVLPYVLQQVNIGAISTSECNSILSDLNIRALSNMLCAYDIQQQRGACQGDSGGPMNCPSDRGYVVAGVASWVIGSSEYSCYTEYPSVYTRTSSFLSWIANNLP